MNYLKIKKIVVDIDDRESNVLEKDSKGKPTKFKQSKCTCKFILEGKEGNEFTWVAENKDLAKALELIAKNEESKYKIPEKEIKQFPSGKFLLGRYLVFLAWLYPIYDKYLFEHGLKIPEEHLEKAKKEKHGKNKD